MNVLKTREFRLNLGVSGGGPRIGTNVHAGAEVPRRFQKVLSGASLSTVENGPALRAPALLTHRRMPPILDFAPILDEIRPTSFHVLVADDDEWTRNLKLLKRQILLALQQAGILVHCQKP